MKITIDDRREGKSDRRTYPSDIIFSCDFTAPLTSYGFTEQSKVPGRATLVKSNGRTCVRLHTEPGDNNVAGSVDMERDDLQLNQVISEGQEEWWAHSVLFPSDYVDPPTSQAGGVWQAGVVFDFHNSLPGGGQANFMVIAMPVAAISPDRPTGLSFQMSWGSQTAPQAQNYPIGSITRNVWYDFVYHVLWSSTNGYLTAMVGGVQKMAYKGPTLYPGQTVYPKLANYHSAFGKASSVLHSRLIRGKTQQSVS